MYTIRNILVTTDFSEYSAAAIEYAQSLGVKVKAKMHLLHVVPELPFSRGPQAGSSTRSGNDPKGATSLREAAAKEEMSRFISEHIDEYTFVEQAVITGQPEKEILGYAKEHHIDLIIMATHGRTGLAHILMGSIAEKIVRTSSVPVMTVKPVELIEPLITNNEVEADLHLTDNSWDSAKIQ